MVATQVVESWLLARRGPAHLAAAGYGFPVLLAQVSGAMAMAAGVSKAVAGDLGRGDRPAAARRTRHGAALALAVGGLTGAIVALGAWLAGGWLPDALTRDHVTLLGAVAPGLTLCLALGGSLRARGDAATPAAILVALALLHAGLARLAILGGAGLAGWGARGAPLAVALAWAAGAAAMAWRVHRREGGWRHPGEAEVSLRASAGEILAVAVPAGVARAARPVTVAWVTALAARVGSDLVAAYGVGGKLQALLALPALALAAALLPFLSQNRAAGRHRRVRRALAGVLGGVALYGLAAWGVAALVRAPMAAAFTASEAARDHLAAFLLLGLFGLPFEALVTVCKAGFHALERSRRTVALGAAQALGTGLLGELGLRSAGAWGLFGALAGAQILTGAGAALWIRRTSRRAPERGAPRGSPGDPREAR